ncbi:YoaK family protein [Fulvimarina sp. MAC3]|uniref:YoaK family protein n=1 Tax=Fulvimarina sp. MAC3 TaxID=3148887 RepID=UPI0031FD7295
MTERKDQGSFKVSESDFQQALSEKRGARGALVGFAFAFAVSLLAGMTDAIGFLSAGDFISFMSGNTTRFAIAFAEARYVDAARLAMILGVFVLGNALGASIVHLAGYRISPLLIFVGCLLAASGMLFHGAHMVFALVPAVLAMGALNSAVESVAGHPVSLTYVTGALSRFGKGLGRLAVGKGDFTFLLHVVPWIGMLSGAIGGSFLQIEHPTISFYVPAGIAAFLAFIAFLLPTDFEKDYLGRV